MWNKRRRGISLIITLVMAAIIAASAMYLHSSVSLETQIATNTRRIMQAKTASVSGMNHFQAMNIFYEQLRSRANEAQSEQIEVIPETTLGDKTFYKVEVHLCCDLGDREFIVVSTGYFKKADRIISTHVSRSLFKTID